MKELLLPLLTEDVVTKLEYEQLLAHPGGPGWQEEHVEETLAERLGDCHERYIEILKEMEETMVLLCKATKVDDEQFQAILQSQNTAASTPTEKAKSKLMYRSYASLQAKKIAYAFTIPQRDALLEELDSFNARLESVLVANDRISGLTRQSVSKPTKPRIPKSLLQFWRHADCMFKLLSEAWTCQCKSLHCARLWLKQRIVATVDMKVMLQFCHGARKCVHIQLADDQLPGSGSSSAVSIRLPLRPIAQQHNLPSITVQQTSSFAKASANSSCVTVTQTSSRVSWASGHQQQNQQGTALPLIRDLGAHDLCDTIKVADSSIGVGGCYGRLTDHSTDRCYTVSNLSDQSTSISAASDVKLCDILDGGTPVVLTRMQRYSIAATLASSLLQLETTPWAQTWESRDVHFAHDTTLEYDKPFFLSRLDATSTAKDDSFKALGTLLLELCFGKPLDQHILWDQPAFAMAKSNPMMRHFVAHEWLKDVEGEAGEQYANAVRFCLQQAPTSLKDDKWRADFAQSVVWPLQQCHESMQPSKRD